MARDGGLLAWQWRDYALRHRDRVNLLIHMIAVPAFIAAVLALVTQLVAAQWLGAAMSAVVALTAFALQGVGHRRERIAPEPFADAGDLVARVLSEQFITFPRFVLAGQWARNLAAPERQD